MLKEYGLCYDLNDQCLMTNIQIFEIATNVENFNSYIILL